MLHVPFTDAAGRPFCLIELMPDQDSYLADIAAQEKRKIVHPLGMSSVEELRDLRVPMGPGFAKAAFATVCHRTNKIGSVIFGHKNNVPINSGVDLQGNVAPILTQKANTPFDDAPTAMVFYEITSLMPGTGADLIFELLRNTSGFERATLSPFRTLSKKFPEFADVDLAPEETLALAALHLLNRGDTVQKFHMGNGASIRDVKLDANTPNSADGRDGKGVMINYGYTGDTDVLKANRAKLSMITTGEAPVETMMELMEPQLVKRIMGVVSGGAMKSVYPSGLVDNMKHAFDRLREPLRYVVN